MEICALASGSSGNCFYIGNNKNAGILIDAGISAKQISERLAMIGKNPSSIKAIFITHEHADHTKGADVFARGFNIPIFATKKTIEQSNICRNKDLIDSIKNKDSFKVAGMEIEAFSKSHKAADPVFFSVSEKKKVSVITDLGYCCKNVILEVSDSNALFLESNHDPGMLEAGPYPYFLKKWVGGDDGHLSNNQASLCILEHGTRKLKHVFLSHLSSTNNTAKIALSTFNSAIKERKDLFPKVEVSFKDRPTGLVKI
jgi:phosphoribosyl 1,2-cyclic phosphodiesterase